MRLRRAELDRRLPIRCFTDCPSAPDNGPGSGKRICCHGGPRSWPCRSGRFWYGTPMSFVAEFNALPLEALLRRSSSATPESVREALARSRPTPTDFAELISPAASGLLETLCRRSQTLTQQRFGKVIRLFAPLYLSNECVNNCRYCGFSRDNPILRVTLSVEEVVAEARHLSRAGFRQILLVAGEHPKFVGRDYLAECVRALAPDFSSIAIEVGPMEVRDYVPIVNAGADGLVVYQEIYNRVG